MADLDITTASAAGWREVRVGRVVGLLPEDLPEAVSGALAELSSTADQATLEDVLDALVASGVRRAPHGVLAEGRRIVVRGECTARLAGEGGADLGTLSHDGRGPWVDLDVDDDVRSVDLRATAGSVDQQTSGLRLVAEWQPPSVLGEVEITRVPLPAGPTGGESGATAEAATSDLGPATRPAASGPATSEPVRTEPAPEDPARQDAPVGGPAPSAPSPEVVDGPGTDLEPPAERADQDEAADNQQDEPTSSPDEADLAPDEADIPDYGFLFGDTQAQRPSLEPSGEDPAAAPLTTGTVDAAAGVVRGDVQGAATLLPGAERAPGEEPQQESQPAPDQPAPDQPEGDLPATPPPADQPMAGGLISAVPWSRSGAGPAVPSPQTPPPVQPVQAQRPAAPPAAPPAAAPAEPPAPTPVPAEQPPPDPPAPSPAAPPAPSEDATATGDDAALDDVTQGRDALIAQAASVDGPKVLAVICPAGHLSPPHRDSCRVCNRQIADQQAFEAARPVLGVLRLESGDKVPLDRGILLGRAPKAKADLEVARQPHVVKLPSPDNDLSRNHLEIVIDGWHVLARDLGSTNGTTVQLPGSAPTRLRPDEHVALEPGTVLVLADVVSVTFEVGP
jgi:hypothetical protein